MPRLSADSAIDGQACPSTQNSAELVYLLSSVCTNNSARSLIHAMWIPHRTDAMNDRVPKPSMHPATCICDAPLQEAPGWERKTIDSTAAQSRTSARSYALQTVRTNYAILLHEVLASISVEQPSRTTAWDSTRTHIPSQPAFLQRAQDQVHTRCSVHGTAHLTNTQVYNSLLKSLHHLPGPARSHTCEACTAQRTVSAPCSNWDKQLPRRIVPLKHMPPLMLQGRHG